MADRKGMVEVTFCRYCLGEIGLLAITCRHCGQPTRGPANEPPEGPGSGLSGLLRRLLRRKQGAPASLPPPAPLPPRQPKVKVWIFEPQGDGTVEVVGASQHQEAIHRFAGGRTPDGPAHPDHFALLKPEPSNRQDPSAVRVYLAGSAHATSGAVGYLSRPDAAAYRPVIDRLAQAGKLAACRAEITGGKSRGAGDAGAYGVQLLLRPPAALGRELDALRGTSPTREDGGQGRS